MITPDLSLQLYLSVTNTKYMNNTNKTKFPHEIRDAKSQSKYKKEKDYLSTSAKLVYLFLVKQKSISSDRTPTYSYMKNFYGVSNGSYKRALDELESFGAISVDTRPYKDTGVLDIEINQKILNSKGFEMIPNSILHTDVYTNDHKLFLAMLWKLYIEKKSNTSKSVYYVLMSDSAIVREMTKIGFSNVHTLNMLKDLSDPQRGWVTVLTKIKKGYMFNCSVCDALWGRIEKLWHTVTSDKTYGYSYPVYVKPIPFDFECEDSDGLYKINRISEERPYGVLAKLSRNQPTIEELEFQKQQDIKKEQEEYED